MAFVKVVEGSEIYNFPIHHFVHFYSKFWSFACSNGGSATRVRASRRRAVTSRAHAPPRRPGRRTFPRLRADRGRAPSPGSRTPRCLEARAPRASPPSRRTCVVHVADHQSVRGAPPYASRPRPPVPRPHLHGHAAVIVTTHPGKYRTIA
jgi:hypothetical protein